MREIKFRAWDKLKREYRYYTIKEIFYLNPTYHQLYFDKHITIEEFTGLKDKNGKEIYEGDIVNWISVGKEGGNEEDIGRKTNMGNREVVFKDGKFITIKPDIVVGNFDTDEIEVIGNKFENPELLR